MSRCRGTFATLADHEVAISWKRVKLDFIVLLVLRLTLGDLPACLEVEGYLCTISCAKPASLSVLPEGLLRTKYLMLTTNTLLNGSTEHNT